MLTLTRYEGQRIYLTPDNGQAIVVQVVEIHGSKVSAALRRPARRADHAGGTAAGRRTAALSKLHGTPVPWSSAGRSQYLRPALHPQLHKGMPVR